MPIDPSTANTLHELAIRWYDYNGRILPMRSPAVSAWGTLVFEVMSQQTPIPRVQPIWLAWMKEWPTPAALAQAPAADVLVAWDRLGYPSRALRLKECAQVIVDSWEGRVPHTLDDLLSLPGIGPYTASAVSAFHYRQRVAVLDTNIRRVLSRVIDGVEHQGNGAPTRAETARATKLLPLDADESATWNVAIMELGALVCSARSPRCQECPLSELCAWRAHGYPPSPQKKKTQAWAGTDRQARGRVMALLRNLHEETQQDKTPKLPKSALAKEAGTASEKEVLAAATLPGADCTQAPRVISTLIADGLIVKTQTGKYRLP